MAMADNSGHTAPLRSAQIRFAELLLHREPLSEVPISFN